MDSSTYSLKRSAEQQSGAAQKPLPDTNPLTAFSNFYYRAKKHRFANAGR
jgi:hypothetical protein